MSAETTQAHMIKGADGCQNQTTFREALLARDGCCLLTGVTYTRCTAAHIIPQSRPEVRQLEMSLWLRTDEDQTVL